MNGWKQIRGSVMLETAITLPVLCYVMFFAFELIRVNQIQISLDAIIEECTMEYIRTSDITKISSIISKYGLQKDWQDGRMELSIVQHPSLKGLCSSSPYGSEDIRFGNYYIPSSGSWVKQANRQVITPSTTSINYKDNAVFVLTCVYDYRFSSTFVGRLFNGGSNTKTSTGAGNKYLLWARGVGLREGVVQSP